MLNIVPCAIQKVLVCLFFYLFCISFKRLSPVLGFKRLLVTGECVCVCVCMQSHLSCVQFFEIPGTVAHQASLSMQFFSQEYWSGLPCPPPGDLSNSGIKPKSPEAPTLAGRFFTTEPPGKPTIITDKNSKQCPEHRIKKKKNSVCVCVCVCLRGQKNEKKVKEAGHVRVDFRQLDHRTNELTW